MTPGAPAGHQKSAAFEYLTTKQDEFVGWARKFSLFPYPFVTACCAMEFMSVSSTLYDTDRFGAALPRFTPRQSDMLMVVGTVTHKQAPILRKVYEQMCEPKWVVAFGVCASTRRLLPELRRTARHRQDHPGRPLHPGLPAAPRDGHRRHHEAAGQASPRSATRSSTRISDRERRSLRHRSVRALAGAVLGLVRRARHPGARHRAGATCSRSRRR